MPRRGRVVDPVDGSEIIDGSRERLKLREVAHDVVLVVHHRRQDLRGVEDLALIVREVEVVVIHEDEADPPAPRSSGTSGRRCAPRTTRHTSRPEGAEEGRPEGAELPGDRGVDPVGPDPVLPDRERGVEVRFVRLITRVRGTVEAEHCLQERVGEASGRAGRRPGFQAVFEVVAAPLRPRGIGPAGRGGTSLDPTRIDCAGTAYWRNSRVSPHSP